MKTTALLTALLCNSITLLSQTHKPKFSDYPVNNIYVGRVKSPILVTDFDKMYRTRLREVAKGKPDFAGKYVLAYWGCGTSCLAGAAIDLTSGRVIWLPGTICCWSYTTLETEPVQYFINSRLLRLTGMLIEEGEIAEHYYLLDKGQFKKLISISINGNKKLINLADDQEQGSIKTQGNKSDNKANVELEEKPIIEENLDENKPNPPK